MKDSNRWDVLGYVLEDPELDRAAFESAMLADVDLAMAVASTVEQVELIRKVVRGSDVGASAPTIVRPATFGAAHDFRATPAGWHWSSLCGLAVALLLAIGLGQAQLSWLANSSDQKLLASSPNVVADRWLALRIDSRSEGTGYIEGIDGVGNEMSESRNPDQRSPDQRELDDTDDWLLEAAREFYLQSVAS